MSTFDVDGLNAGYARALLEEYLENPEAVPSEWRQLFESGDSQLVATHPGIARLLEALRGNGDGGGSAAGTSAAGSYGSGVARTAHQTTPIKYRIGIFITNMRKISSHQPELMPEQFSAASREAPLRRH